MKRIRKYQPDDWPKLWQMLESVFHEGKTYAVSIDINERDAKQFWIKKPVQTYVIVDENESVCGTYYIKPNQPGPGSHVCNCGYIVAEDRRGEGIASLLCEHSQKVAREMGFISMQFNLVVSTNIGAIKLWRKHGFEIVGTIPSSFDHPEIGYVDCYVMFKKIKAE